MPMTDAQIRIVIEQKLADCPGAFYGAAQNAARNANGDRGFAAPFDFGKITQQSRTHAGQYDYMTAVSTCIV